MDRINEKLALQIAAAVAACVPVSAGLSGMILGERFLGEVANVSSDSHFRYLSGILFAIGLSIWASLPRIESHRPRFVLVTFLVAAGGLARLYGLLTVGVPNPGMLFGLAMELVVTPALLLWQSRVARRYAAVG